MTVISLQIKYIKYVFNKGVRAVSGRPPTFLGYVQGVCFSFIISIRIMFDDYLYLMFEYFIWFDLAFDWCVDLLWNNRLTGFWLSLDSEV